MNVLDQYRPWNKSLVYRSGYDTAGFSEIDEYVEQVLKPKYRNTNFLTEARKNELETQVSNLRKGLGQEILHRADQHRLVGELERYVSILDFENNQQVFRDIFSDKPSSRFDSNGWKIYKKREGNGKILVVKVDESEESHFYSVDLDKLHEVEPDFLYTIILEREKKIAEYNLVSQSLDKQKTTHELHEKGPTKMPTVFKTLSEEEDQDRQKITTRSIADYLYFMQDVPAEFSGGLGRVGSYAAEWRDTIVGDTSREGLIFPRYLKHMVDCPSSTQPESYTNLLNLYEALDNSDRLSLNALKYEVLPSDDRKILKDIASYARMSRDIQDNASYIADHDSAAQKLYAFLEGFNPESVFDIAKGYGYDVSEGYEFVSQQLQGIDKQNFLRRFKSNVSKAASGSDIKKALSISLGGVIHSVLNNEFIYVNGENLNFSDPILEVFCAAAYLNESFGNEEAKTLISLLIDQETEAISSVEKLNDDLKNDQEVFIKFLFEQKIPLEKIRELISISGTESVDDNDYDQIQKSHVLATYLINAVYLYRRGVIDIKSPAFIQMMGELFPWRKNLSQKFADLVSDL